MGEKKSKTIEHPLEEVLGIEPGTTEIERAYHPIEKQTHDTYDEKDDEVEDHFNEVYQKALEAFETQTETAEITDPRYSARAMEVAERFLNTALNAAKEKSLLKQHKDKISTSLAKGPNQTTNNNLIVADRNDLLKQILGDKEEGEN